MTRLLALAALGGALAFTGTAAHADTSCTDVNGSGTVCTTSDTTSPSAGVGVHVGPLNVCVVVLATCP